MLRGHGADAAEAGMTGSGDEGAVAPGRRLPPTRPGGNGVVISLTNRNELVERHRGLAIGLATRFAGKGEEMDDLVQVAMMALTKAIDRFEPDRGVALSTFATITIL